MLPCLSKFFCGGSISSSILKKLLPVILIIGLAAAWSLFSGSAERKEVNTPVEEKKPEVKEVKKEVTHQEVRTSPVIPQSKPPQPSVEKDPPPLPANPYEQFMKAVEPNNLNDSLKSLDSGELRDEQVIKRNEYFEKLSQQLKELQGNGGGPPPGIGEKTEGEPELAAEPSETLQIPEEPELIEEQGVITDEPEILPEEELPVYELPPEDDTNSQ